MLGQEGRRCLGGMWAAGLRWGTRAWQASPGFPSGGMGRPEGAGDV